MSELFNGWPVQRGRGKKQNTNLRPHLHFQAVNLPVPSTQWQEQGEERNVVTHSASARTENFQDQEEDKGLLMLGKGHSWRGKVETT